MERWRAVVWVGLLVATWVGCSGKSDREGGPQAGAGQGGGAGQGVSAGKGGGTAAGGGIGGTGGAGARGGTGGTGGSDNEAGSGDLTSGGSTTLAGRGATGGFGAFAGAGGASVAGAGGTLAAGRGGDSGVAGAGNVPIAWGCSNSKYGDGVCDCGCNIMDIDCTKDGIDQCEVCNLVGSCNRADCPGRIDPKDITTCLAPPKEWTCSPGAYGDGTVCDCGCGALDLDCPNKKLSSCDTCSTTGSCSFSACPGKLTPDDNSTCYVPPTWNCDPFYYGDGACNCGCGAVDIDCPDANASSCQSCPAYSCSDSGNCDGIQSDDNAYCSTPPSLWNCPARLYHDGNQCDCGCGAVDPDCASRDSGACDRCNSPGSCSVVACPGLINTTQNDRCTMPPAPDGWLCGDYTYGDAHCDCGCGVPDIDCLGTDPNACESCARCAGSCNNLDPTDVTQCEPPPSGWTCDPATYYDFVCECGCGVLDPDCGQSEMSYVCDGWPVEGCSGGNKSHIQPNHNERCTITIPSAWVCDRGYYGDGICDCGCGAVDNDCASSNVSACDNCNDAKSCSQTACPGTIVATDNAHCSN
ncbi:MAG TPA: hypothetical protein VMI54_20650 [Polyangiaceae bacterium]|nr:hypothetical protein [Polyangiaceae bacterium]